MKKNNLFDWNQISIAKYYEICDIIEEGNDDITTNIKILSLISGEDEEYFWDMDITKIGDVAAQLNFLGKFEIPKISNFNIKLPHYDLNVIKDITKLNIAQYVDFQHFTRLKLRDGIDKILSVFLIPKGKKYNTDYDIVDVQKEIREYLSFPMAQALLSFFMSRSGEFLLHSLTCCKQAMKKEKNLERKEKMLEKIAEMEKMFQNLIHTLG